jgi:NodT family efflux transporter outer membrane factor (OMF) lipoprotein
LVVASAAVLTLAAVVMSGCRAKVQKVPVPLEAPATFSRSGDGAPADAWWRDLRDERLNRLMDRAFAGSFSLKAAYDRLLAAQAAARVAGAELYPEVTGTAGVSQTWVRDDITNDTEDFRRYEVGAVASYEVDLWGRIRSVRNAAVLEAAATEEDLRAAAVLLSGNVASTWYRLREQESQLDLLRSQMATTSETLTVLEGRFRRGLVGASDVLQQRQLLESRREELERATAERRLLEITLATLVGSAPPPENTYEAGGGLIALLPLPETGIPAEAVARRPDVRSAYLDVQAADQRWASAVANRYPRLSLSASYSAEEPHWQDLFDNWAASLAANLAAPLFDGGSRRAEADRRRALVRERFHVYADVYLNALAEVERALIAEAQQKEVVESVGRQLTLAREVLKRITREYLGGRSEYLRVLTAQLSLQSLERGLLTAQRQLIEARVDLARALSGGWNIPEYEPPPVVAESRNYYPFPIPIHGEVE